jgi:glycosyltransferase involved in cell wall biosynthesis
MRNPIEISAVIPTYNRERTLTRAIDSVLGQEFPAVELIIIDDGSNDSTRKIVEGFGPQCRYEFQENSGVSVARNRGVRKARSDWIAFLDSDDYWVPQHLSRMVDAIRATNGEAALYFSDVGRDIEDGPASYWESTGFRIDGPYVFQRDASPWALFPIQPMLLQASVIKRACYWDVGALPPALRTREDTLLFFKLGLLYPACAVSGRGAVMTSEGTRRLTREIQSHDLRYWQATLSVYREMLGFAARFRPDHRRFFLDRMGAAYFSLGRLTYRQGKPFQAVANLVRSAGRSPSRFMKCLRESLGSRLAGR